MSESCPENLKNLQFLIVGSGIIGATYARLLVDGGKKVGMIDVGAQETAIAGDHIRNTMPLQRDSGSFLKMVDAGLSTLSIPAPDPEYVYRSMNPIAWKPNEKYARRGENILQDVRTNVDNARVTRCVGGMCAYWACAVVPQSPEERLEHLCCPCLLYDKANRLVKANDTAFDSSKRHRIVQETLSAPCSATKPCLHSRPCLVKQPCPQRKFLSIPLAVQTSEGNSPPNSLTWSSARTVFGGMSKILRSNHICLKLVIEEGEPHVVKGARIKNLANNNMFTVTADNYIICAGAVLTPQILFNSSASIKSIIPSLGHFMMDHTLAGCQIAFKESLVELMGRGTNKDPLSFLDSDPDAQVYSPVDTHQKRRWYSQISRSALYYGENSGSVDSRVILDLLWYGMIEPERTNRVYFSDKSKDSYGMPQPIFHFKYSKKDIETAHDMLRDMKNVAAELGGYVPGSEPHHKPLGTALHMTGTYRAGKDKGDSVVDKNSKVHGFKNLYLGGNGVLPIASASSPTLTSMCYAIQSAQSILGYECPHPCKRYPECKYPNKCGY